MQVAQAQREVRTAFLGGSIGQGVSGALWALSAALGTWRSPTSAIVVLMAGGTLIFPFTLLVLRALGRPAGLPRAHPMNALGVQVAFVLPLSLPVAGAATLYRLEWFYPAVMILTGAHYLPFAFLYGMRLFAVLGSVLAGAGVWIALRAPDAGFALGGWLTAGVLFAFAIAAGARDRRERRGRVGTSRGPG